MKNAKAISRNGKTIIEKYMGGKQDFTVTYLVAEGEPYPVRIGDRYLGRVEDGWTGSASAPCLPPGIWTFITKRSMGASPAC